MPMPIQNISMTAPQAEMADIERKRRLAEALQQQSMQDIPTTQAGGWTVPISPFQGLAKMLQAYAGSKGMQDATDREKRLMEDYNARRSEALAGALQAREGTPERWTGEGIDSLYTPAQAGSKAAMLKALGSSQFPDLQQLALGESLKGEESLFGKVDTKDYTPESVAQFMRTRNYSDLVPVRPLSFHNTGNAVQGFNSINGAPVGPATPINQSPDSTANLNWQRERLGLISAERQAQLDQGERGLGIQATNAANRGIETQFNTGQGAMPPRFPAFQTGAATAGQSQGAPTPAPQAPITGSRNRPAGANVAGLTPKQQSEIRMSQAERQRGARMVLEAIGYNPKTGADQVAALIKKSTSGAVQNAAAAIPGWFGHATSGREAIGQLDQKVSKLTMDLMGGKLGAGISNADREFVISQLGNVANANVPANERLAAWNSAIQMLNNIVGGSGGGASGSFGSSVRDQADAILQGGR